MLDAICIFWLAVNVVAFTLYGVDKRRARRGAWRIPEKTLLLFTWLFGGVGAFAGMRVFRHKTKHPRFVISATLGMVVSLAGLMLAIWQLI